MGAWSHTSFANDDALDWAAGLVRRGVTAIKDAFAAVSENDEEYLEVDAACAALAAAEVVAALASAPAPNLPKKVTAWLVGKGPPTPELLEAARRAVKRVLRASELRDLWNASPKAETWRAEVEGLLARLV
jgi:precorrin-6B methylase 2